MNFIAICAALANAAKLLPTAVAIATALQQSLPDTLGSIKMDGVKAGILEAIKTEQALVAEFEAAWPWVKPILSGIISVLKSNSLLGFKPDTTPAA